LEKKLRKKHRYSPYMYNRLPYSNGYNRYNGGGQLYSPQRFRYGGGYPGYGGNYGGNYGLGGALGLGGNMFPPQVQVY